MADSLQLPASSVADAIAYVIGQPNDVDVSEIVVRPRAEVA
jgi:NADP-dependent 3-hydroxy acid dehydrogenase YdfG